MHKENVGIAKAIHEKYSATLKKKKCENYFVLTQNTLTKESVRLIIYNGSFP